MIKTNHSITDVPGILVGNAQDDNALTGCTVVICEKGATGGVDQRGGAPGTRETDLLHPMHLVSKVHAIVLSGGSAFGLDAASGVMTYLEKKKVGFFTGAAHVPIVCSAILYDLGVGNPKIRPDAVMGSLACKNASNQPFKSGNTGAGCGATVGKIFGIHSAMKSGLGTASIDLGGGLIVGALVAVNAFGDVIDPRTNLILAGARPISKGPIRLGGRGKFANTLDVMRTIPGKSILNIAGMQNTVIGVIVTNAKLSKEGTNKVAQMAQDGLAMAIRPAHTMLDGDTVFALSTGKISSDVNIVGAYAAQVMADAIVDAVLSSDSAGGLPASKNYV